jgi:flagellar hook-basal body complex protein FliE
MAQGINPVGVGPVGPGGLTPAAPGGRDGGPSFKDILAAQIGQVNELQLDAEQAINDLAAGKTGNVTEVMAAVEKADLAFRNLMAIRNKIIDAYREIQQLRI